MVPRVLHFSAFMFFRLLGQPSEPSSKESVLKGDVDSTKDLSVSCGKGRVPGHDRATRMTVKASSQCKGGGQVSGACVLILFLFFAPGGPPYMLRS